VCGQPVSAPRLVAEVLVGFGREPLGQQRVQLDGLVSGVDGIGGVHADLDVQIREQARSLQLISLGLMNLYPK
jgi:hypothetical protein